MTLTVSLASKINIDACHTANSHDVTIDSISPLGYRVLFALEHTGQVITGIQSDGPRLSRLSWDSGLPLEEIRCATNYLVKQRRSAEPGRTNITQPCPLSSYQYGVHLSYCHF